MSETNNFEHATETHGYEQPQGNSSRPTEGEAPVTKPRRPRGFAAMDRSLVSAIARKGGKAAHEAGTAHEFTSEEARAAWPPTRSASPSSRRTTIPPTDTAAEGASRVPRRPRSGPRRPPSPPLALARSRST